MATSIVRCSATALTHAKEPAWLPHHSPFVQRVQITSKDCINMKTVLTSTLSERVSGTSRGLYCSGWEELPGCEITGLLVYAF